VTGKVSSSDILIVGAGAAGLMCAMTAAAKGKRIQILEKNKKPGAKILISGGGRCNFTNEDVSAANYISENKHFSKSALSRYTPWDFMSLLGESGLTWHEKTLGQLFCDQGSKAVLEVLLKACSATGVQLETDVAINSVAYEEGHYSLRGDRCVYKAPSLVIASGGVSIPKMGATGFGYEVARQFGLKVVEPVPALVPLTFAPDVVGVMKSLAGVSVDCLVACGGTSFRENLLFTHRGLSGPAILQISSYWRRGDTITVNLMPQKTDVFAWLKGQRQEKPKAGLKAVLGTELPERLAVWLADPWPGVMADQSNQKLQSVADTIARWQLTPTGSEGFKKAEVTRGGVSTEFLSSKTLEAKNQPGLYFIGECVDVTGWLGGYNFQWAWASGHACGSALQ